MKSGSTTGEGTRMSISRTVATLVFMIAMFASSAASAQSDDPNSCEGYCGGQAPGGCYCDPQCCDFGDCCFDMQTVCFVCRTNPFSCAGVCGGLPGACWCDEACCVFSDCCPDKFVECGGCNPNGPSPPGDINGDGLVNVPDLLAVSTVGDRARRRSRAVPATSRRLRLAMTSSTSAIC